MGRQYTSRERAGADEALDFTLDGERFVCSKDISVLDLSELASFADLDSQSPEGIAAIQGFLRIVLGPAEFGRFRRFCAQRRVDDDTLIDIITDLCQDFLGRPTQASSSSPGSPSATGPGSTAPGSHMVVNLGSGRVAAAPLSLAEIGDVQVS